MRVLSFDIALTIYVVDINWQFSLPPILLQLLCSTIIILSFNRTQKPSNYFSILYHICGIVYGMRVCLYPLSGVSRGKTKQRKKSKSQENAFWFHFFFGSSLSVIWCVRMLQLDVEYNQIFIVEICALNQKLAVIWASHTKRVEENESAWCAISFRFNFWYTKYWSALHENGNFWPFASLERWQTFIYFVVVVVFFTIDTKNYFSHTHKVKMLKKTHTPHAYFVKFFFLLVKRVCSVASIEFVCALCGCWYVFSFHIMIITIAVGYCFRAGRIYSFRACSACTIACGNEKINEWQPKWKQEREREREKREANTLFYFLFYY